MVSALNFRSRCPSSIPLQKPYAPFCFPLHRHFHYNAIKILPDGIFSTLEHLYQL